MLSIVISNFDPDETNDLPRKWGEDYQVDSIESVYLNGHESFLLNLSPLSDSYLKQFNQGCKPIYMNNNNSDYPYYYLLCLLSPIPPAIGSNWNISHRITEIKLVLRECRIDFTSGLGLHWHWRLTLGKRRDPILFLPSVKTDAIMNS